MANQTGRKSKQGSFLSVSIMFSITLALFVAGLFGVLVVFSKQLEKIVQDNIRIQVYLKQDLQDSARVKIRKQLESGAYINQEIEEPVRFISKDEAAKKFILETGEDFYKFMGENPLHDSFVIAVGAVYQSPQQLNNIKKILEKISGVHYVDFNPNLIESMNRNRNILGGILMGSALALFGVVILLIRNTLRLALFSQRFLIRSMQLVGATRSFIIKPFLIRAIVYGLAGALFASLLILGLLSLIARKFPELSLIVNRDQILIVFAILGVLGIFVSVYTTWRAIQKYLALSLDELY
jgi:cell division transport system permease protein